ncbi:Radial spoke head protein 3 like protein [Habropoda laboriosa]|uniref:Radial spoke head protein 3 like protein n=1 Tax=Habropoda laboriosa TaxID=597456 RepID=A0A0L7RIW4_9HYME|nr:Radial spoke head protein 3 like protein [Habropoda laboriosa]
MPAGISALAPTANGDPFGLERKDPPAFAILQKDGLGTSLPILQVNGNSGTNRSEVARLENAKNELFDRKRISRSNDHLVQACLQSSYANPARKETRSRSQDSLRSVVKIPAIKPSITLSTEDFNDVLNAKLKKLQEQEKEKIDGEQSIAARQAEARRRNLARKRAQAQATKALVARAGSPPPVPGRKHEPVQTEVYLEELSEKPDETEVATQTDYFLDRPPTPKYCPDKVGEDRGTQIEPGDLFDFDLEVQPMLEVLVGKTMEQALIEILEEEEIAALKEQQRKFLELRAAERAEERRLEEQERRIREEKDQRLRQHEKAVTSERDAEERVAAATLLTGYIAELLPAVLEGLKMSGFLLDEIKADVEESFVPWLMKEVKKEMGNMIESRELLTEIIREILESRAETYRNLGEEYDASRRRKPSSLMDHIEDGGRDPNFLNYQPPVIENSDDV